MLNIALDNHEATKEDSDHLELSIHGQGRYGLTPSEEAAVRKKRS